MNKEELKKRIEELKNQIKTNSVDKHFAEKLLEDLVSAKGQYDVEEAELIIPKKDVVKEYDFDSFKFVRTKKGILFHVRGGFDTFVSIRMTSLYERLSSLLELKDRYENLVEEERKAYDSIFTANYYVLSMPFLLSPFDEEFFEAASKNIEVLNNAYEKYVKNAELQEETPAEDAEFEKNNGMLNEIMGTDA